MPTIQIPGPYKFGFYSNENNEPAHVHVTRDSKECKFWIGPVRLADGGKFAAHELKKIETLIIKHENEIQAKWDEHEARRGERR
jgi:hypothetical protein